MCCDCENVDDVDAYDASDDEIYDKEDDVVQAFPAGGIGDQCSQGAQQFPMGRHSTIIIIIVIVIVTLLCYISLSSGL